MPKKNPPSSDPLIATLREERQRRGLSQQALGNLLGRSSYSTVWQWENEMYDILLSNYREWANVLGFDVVLVARETEPGQARGAR